MALEDYGRKRRFDRTHEPPPSGAGPKRKPGAARFVVQLHHARRRHYDFRLQVGNVLRSWAVPKGPSLDPRTKRMAVEVEDHPLAYERFEGSIPPGEYGAGTVQIFDRGTWSTTSDPTEQLRAGHLRFELFGEKLRGAWHLVRTRSVGPQKQWLLIKQEDGHAAALEADALLDRSAADEPPARARSSHTASKGGAWHAEALALPGAVPAQLPEQAPQPQLAAECGSPPRGDGWIHELKWDGYRLLATVTRSIVRLWSRNGQEWTERFPHLVEALETLRLRDAIFDGELIAGAGATADFGRLQRTLAAQSHAQLRFVAFDLIHLEGVDVSRAPLVRRKALLADVLASRPGLLGLSTHVAGSGTEAYEVAIAQGFEGIVSKRADAPYVAGRSGSWCKCRARQSDDFAVVGFTPPKGSREHFGALLLASRMQNGSWRYAGRVGSGFSDALIGELASRLGRARAEPTVEIEGSESTLRGAKWFAPRFVVEVAHRGLSNTGLLRQPSLHAVRWDKNVEDIEQRGSGEVQEPEHPARHRRSPAEAGSRQRERGSAGSERSNTKVQGGDLNASGKALSLSSPEKTVFADAGLTKRDVWDYYSLVADRLLQHIGGRPVSTIRCPDGVANSCFFQRHEIAGLKVAGTLAITGKRGGAKDYLVVEDRTALLELVQFNVLEFHPWGAMAASPERADRMIFDLDPGPGVSFEAVKAASLRIRELLRRLELKSFLRVSGGKGLHVVVPLNPGCEWSLVKRFARGFAESLATADPDHFVAKASKAIRSNRIFIDYLRNDFGATAVAAYSLRARPGAPVAMPIRWEQLESVNRADQFSLVSMMSTLKRRQACPWAGIDDVRQSLGRWQVSR